MPNKLEIMLGEEDKDDARLREASPRAGRSPRGRTSRVRKCTYAKHEFMLGEEDDTTRTTTLKQSNQPASLPLSEDGTQEDDQTVARENGRQEDAMLVARDSQAEARCETTEQRLPGVAARTPNRRAFEALI